MLKNTATATAALTLLCAPVFAQNPARTESAVRQFTAPKTSAPHKPSLAGSITDPTAVPSLYPGEESDLGPQHILLEAARRAAQWEVGFDVQAFYTSNAFFSEKANRDTGVLALSASVAWAPEPIAFLGGQLSPRVGYRHQRYLYSIHDSGSGLNDFDFDAATVFATARLDHPGGWSHTFGLEYNRLLSLDADATEFYTEFAPNWGVDRYWTVANGHTLSISYAGTNRWAYTDPQPTSHANDRLDNAITLAWTWEPISGIYIQPFYRWQWSHYWDNTDRNDFLDTLGLSTTWQINDWATLRTFASYEVRNSTDDLVTDYHKWDLGGGLSLSVRF